MNCSEVIPPSVICPGWRRGCRGGENYRDDCATPWFGVWPAATPGGESWAIFCSTPATSTNSARCSGGSSPRPGRRSLLGPAALAAIGDGDPFHPELGALRADLPTASPRGLASAWELRTYMADLLLRDSDVMSMRHSLELRVPFVDRPLIEWLWRQPDAFRFTPGRPKDALAAAVADLLPPGLRERPKRGFSLPMPVWMRRELKPFLDETFSEQSVQQSGLFQRGVVQSTWENFLRSDDRREWSRVWSLAVLIAFVNRRNPAPRPPGAAGVAPVVSSAPRPPAPVLRPAARTGRASPVSRTLLMVPEIFNGTGGIQRILQLYLKALSDLGAETDFGVRLLALNDSLLDSTDVRRYANGHLDDWFVCNRHKKRFVRAALRMSRGCNRLVCGHVAQLPVAWTARRIRPRLRYYLVAHGVEVWRPFNLLERLALRGAHKIFCVSEFTRQELERRCPLKPGHAVVVPNALDPFFTVQAGVPLAECPPVILTVARLSESDRYKGVEHLIAAMPAVRAAKPAAELRIIGRGDDLRRLQKQAHDLGLQGRGVSFLGFVDDRQLAKEMRGCRLFALPSSREGFGLVFLEAMAHGRPCLGARAGGVPEVVTPETGVLVEPANVASIAEGCLAGMRKPWNQDAILARARQFSYASFKERLSVLLAEEPVGKS